MFFSIPVRGYELTLKIISIYKTPPHVQNILMKFSHVILVDSLVNLFDARPAPTSREDVGDVSHTLLYTTYLQPGSNTKSETVRDGKARCCSTCSGLSCSFNCNSYFKWCLVGPMHSNTVLQIRPL